MARRANESWNLPHEITWQHVEVALLMDLRDELQKLNRLLHCSNFTNIPRKLDSIKTSVARIPRKKRKAKGWKGLK